jgi:hypothetical protein
MRPGNDGGEVTDSGARLLARLGADLAVKSGSKRIFCRPCLDWSERRYHIAGHVGAEICRKCLEYGWLERERGTRALHLTSSGARGLDDSFGLKFSGDRQERSRRVPSANSAKAVQPV